MKQQGMITGHQPSTPTGNGRKRLSAALLALTVAVGGLTTIPTQTAEAGAPVAATTTTIAPMLERVTPAVVNISVLQRAPETDNPLLRDPVFRRFFNIPDMPRARPQMSAGSGVIVDARNGYIITNHHVVERAEAITVTLKDRRKLKAELVGSDAATDIAVLKVSADNLTELPWGNSDAARVGDFVVAIGNPFGLGQTVTSGIVSALGRSGLKIEGYEDFIQTDASINPGNSGGALVTFNGELLGINTAIIGPAGGSVGIGFAVPVSIARSVMDQLIKYKEVRRGRLGIALQELTPDIAESLGIAANEGALIARVETGSPADSGGLRAGDVVVAVDGRPIHSASDLRNQIGLVRLGTSMQLEIIRGGRNRTITVKPGR